MRIGAQFFGLSVCEEIGHDGSLSATINEHSFVSCDNYCGMDQTVERNCEICGGLLLGLLDCVRCDVAEETRNSEPHSLLTAAAGSSGRVVKREDYSICLFDLDATSTAPM